MIYISEWLPNPKGADAPGEWLELFNDSSEPASLEGWRITADGKKFFKLQGMIGAGSRLVSRRAENKIALKNTDGSLALYDPSGKLADRAGFIGSAPEGQSANRAKDSAYFGEPTPGAPNIAATRNLAQGSGYPLGVALNVSGTSSELGAFGSLLGTALALAAAVVFILKSHEDLSNLFFQRNADLGRGHRGEGP